MYNVHRSKRSAFKNWLREFLKTKPIIDDEVQLEIDKRIQSELVDAEDEIEELNVVLAAVRQKTSLIESTTSFHKFRDSWLLIQANVEDSDKLIAHNDANVRLEDCSVQLVECEVDLNEKRKLLAQARTSLTDEVMLEETQHLLKRKAELGSQMVSCKNQLEKRRNELVQFQKMSGESMAIVNELTQTYKKLDLEAELSTLPGKEQDLEEKLQKVDSQIQKLIESES